tara:strand:- start:145 stop:315 length:171 start_codon:yes stop_codon:yes gene_type:complete
MKKDFILDVFITATRYDDNKLELKKHYFHAKDLNEKLIHDIRRAIAKQIEVKNEVL